jgi:hypothetical protein
MAKLKCGILGGLKGSLGNVSFYNKNSKCYIRKLRKGILSSVVFPIASYKSALFNPKFFFDKYSPSINTTWLNFPTVGRDSFYNLNTFNFPFFVNKYNGASNFLVLSNPRKDNLFEGYYTFNVISGFFEIVSLSLVNAMNSILLGYYSIEVFNSAGVKLYGYTYVKTGVVDRFSFNIPVAFISSAYYCLVHCYTDLNYSFDVITFFNLKSNKHTTMFVP